MSQYLLYEGFERLEDPETFDIRLVMKDSNIGPILKVVMGYPEELHDLHNEYSYFVEGVVVKKDMLSDYCSTVSAGHKIKSGNCQKLFLNLCNEKKYVIHKRNFKQAVDALLMVPKIHRVLQFKQKPWMNEYIDFNTEQHKLAKNDFEKDFFKLLNNSVYGARLEDVRKRQNIKLRMIDKLINREYLICVL